MKRQRRPRNNEAHIAEAAADAASAAASAHVSSTLDALPPSMPPLIPSTSISVLAAGSGSSSSNEDANSGQQGGIRNPSLQLQIPMSARGDAPPTSSFSPFTRVVASTPSLQSASSFRFQQSNLNMLLSTPAATPLGNASNSFMSPFLQTGASPYSTTFTHGSGSGRVKSRRSQLESTRNSIVNATLDTAAASSSTNVVGASSDFSSSPQLVPIRTSSMMAPLFPHLDEGDETHASHGDSHDAGDTQLVNRLPTHSPLLATASSLVSTHASEGAASSAAGSTNMNHLSLSIPQDDEARDILLHTIDYTPQRLADQSNLFEGLYFQQHDTSTGANAASAAATGSMLFTPLSSPARNAATGLHTTTAAAGQSNLFQFLPNFTPRFSRDMSTQLREGSRDAGAVGDSGEMAPVSGTVISSNTGGAPLSPARSPARYLDSSSATAAAAAAFGCLPALPSPGPRHSSFQYDQNASASHAPTPVASSSSASAFSNSMFNLNSVRALNSTSSSSNLPILSSPSVRSGPGLPISSSFSFSPTPSSIARSQRLSRLKQRAAKAGVNEYLQLPSSSTNTPSSSTSRLPLLASPVHRTTTLQSSTTSAFNSNLPDLLASPSTQYSKRRRLNTFHDDAADPMDETEEAEAANAFLFAEEGQSDQQQHTQHDHSQLDETAIESFSANAAAAASENASAAAEPAEKPAKRQRRSKKDKEQVSPQPPIHPPEQSPSTSQEVVAPQLPAAGASLFSAENLQLQAQLAFMAQLHHLRIVAAMPHRATIVANAHQQPPAQTMVDTASIIEADKRAATPPPIVTDYSGVPAPFIESAVLPSNPLFRESAAATEVATAVVRTKKRKELASAAPTTPALNVQTTAAASAAIQSPTIVPLAASLAASVAPGPTSTANLPSLQPAAVHTSTATSVPAPTIATPAAPTRTVIVASIPPSMTAAVAEPANTILVAGSTSPVPVPASAVSTLVPSLNLLSSTALGAAAIPATIAAPSAPATAATAAAAALAPTVTAAISVPMARTVSSSTPATAAVAVPAINAATPASASRTNVTTATAVAQPVAIRPSDAEKQAATPALAQSHNQPFIPQARTVLSTAKETVAATVVPPAPAIAASTVVAAAAPTVIATTAALPTAMQSATASVNPSPLPAKPLLATGVVTASSTAPVSAAVAAIAPVQSATTATTVSAPTETIARVLQPSPGSPQITPAVAIPPPASMATPVPTSVELSNKAGRAATSITAPLSAVPTVPGVISASGSILAATPMVDFDRDRAAAAYMNMANAATSTNMSPADFMNLFYASMPHVLSATAAAKAPGATAVKKAVPAPKPVSTPQSIAQKALQINKSNSSTMLLPALYSETHLNEETLEAEGIAAIKIPHDDCKRMVLNGLQFLQRTFAAQGFQKRMLAEAGENASSERFVLPTAYSDRSIDSESSFDLTRPIPAHVELNFFNVQREALLNHLRTTFPRELTFLLHRLAQHALFIHIYGFVAYQQNFACPPAVPSVVEALSEGAEYREEKKVEHAIKKQSVKMKRKYDRMSKLTASTLLTMEDVLKVVSLASRG